MSSGPLVSIIVPAYNQSAFLAETLDSILTQRFSDLEIIVLDDGSTDATPQVIRPYEGRVIAVRHANRGENPTVNRGFGMAKGGIVCVVNADDPLLPGAIETAVDCLERDREAIAAYPNWHEIDSSGQIVKTIHLPSYDIGSMLFDFNVAMGPGVFFRRSAFDRIGFRNPTLRYTGDLDYWFRLSLVGRFHHIARPLATHRTHANAASSAARGGRMAAEVVRLIDTVSRSDAFPTELKPYRSMFYARAHAAAAHCCGADETARRWHETLCWWHRRCAKLRSRNRRQRCSGYSGRLMVTTGSGPSAIRDLLKSA